MYEDMEAARETYDGATSASFVPPFDKHDPQTPRQAQQELAQERARLLSAMVKGGYGYPPASSSDPPPTELQVLEIICDFRIRELEDRIKKIEERLG